MIHPVPKIKGKLPVVSSSFQSSSRPDHNGVDIMYRRDEAGSQILPVYAKRFFMPNGVPALAIDSGVVRTSRQIGTGGLVEINHSNGLMSQYMHLRNRKVKVGDTVKPGQPVGDISHNPTGFRLNHLHFQMRKNGRLIDPEPFLRTMLVVDKPFPFGFVGKLALTAAISYATYRVLQ